jgi:hypothetical protein
MSLFKKDQLPAMRIEPLPLTGLQLAQAEFHDASVTCRASSEHCARLDAEQKYWLTRREQAQTDFNSCLQRYSAAQDALAKLQSIATSKIAATGTTQPIVAAVGAVLP